MKKILKLMIFSFLLLTLLWACNKDENKDYFLGGTPPVMTAVSNTSADSIQMKPADSTKAALSLSWTNPNYKFTTGISSQDVTYQIQIDTAGDNFTNPQMQVISVNKSLSYVITETQLNGIMLNQLGLAVNVPHGLQIRVISGIGTAVPLTSNAAQYHATPYVVPPKVNPPASGELYITGNALPSGWTNSPPPAQKFTRLSATLYEITVPLIGGNSYTFLPTWGSWNDKYSISVKNDPSEVNGGDFQWQGNDILAPAASGNYKISVDFQKGKFTVTKQ
ncbi:MAG TPA: SusE domain-containing protein [Chitinophagaceae bacterium]